MTMEAESKRNEEMGNLRDTYFVRFQPFITIIQYQTKI